jgi:AraC-like DNA-binding protein
LHVSANVVAGPGPREAHMHAGLEVGVLLAGCQERSFEGLTYQVSPGETWLCGSWEPHGWQALEPDTSYFVAECLPQFLAEGAGDFPWLEMFAVPPPARPRVSDELMRAKCLATGLELQQEAADRHPGWQTMIRILVIRLLLIASRAWMPSVPPSRPGVTSTAALGRLLPALQQVNASPEQRLSLAQAARLCGVGRTGFARLFRRTLGVSFGRYRLRARVAAAARSLVLLDLPLEAIADLTGFSDGSHLHHVFVRHYGISPGRYREAAIRQRDRLAASQASERASRPDERSDSSR